MACPVGTPLGTVNRLYLAAQSQSMPSAVDSAAVGQEIILQHGDANFDGAINVGDAVYLVNHVFKGGAMPQPVLLAGDANCDGAVNVGDAVFIINFVFKGGPRPTCNP